MNVSTFGPPIQPGRDAVDAHAGRAELDRHRLRRGLHRGLRRRVAALELADLAHAHRDDEHDRRVAVLGGGLLEVRDARLGEAERAPHVDLEDLAPLREVDRVERLERVHAERVVDEHVEPAELARPSGRRAPRPARRRRGWSAPRGPRRRPPRSPSAPGRGSRRCGPPAPRGALPGQGPGVGLAQAGADAGHDHDLVVEQHRRQVRHPRGEPGHGEPARGARARTCDQTSLAACAMRSRTSGSKCSSGSVS